MAWRNKRVCGYVGAIRKPEEPHNAGAPRRIQLVVRVPFTTSSDMIRRDLFMRANAFSIHYMPLNAEDADVFLGDTLTGVIEAPRSEKHNSA